MLRQTRENFEAIVCDDGSKDNSREVVQEYVKQDSRVRLVAQENRGVTSAVNTAYDRRSERFLSGTVSPRSSAPRPTWLALSCAVLPPGLSDGKQIREPAGHAEHVSAENAIL